MSSLGGSLAGILRTKVERNYQTSDFPGPRGHDAATAPTLDSPGLHPSASLFPTATLPRRPQHPRAPLSASPPGPGSHPCSLRGDRCSCGSNEYNCCVTCRKTTFVCFILTSQNIGNKREKLSYPLQNYVKKNMISFDNNCHTINNCRF